MNDDYLMHHGVKGMKWGQHIFGNKTSSTSRNRSSKSTSSKKPSSKAVSIIEKRRAKKLKVKKQKEREKRAKETRKNQRRADIKKRIKPVSKMTDAELSKIIKRKQLEKQYRDLNKQSKSQGRKIVEEILEKSAKNIAEQAVTYAIGTAVNKVARKNIVNPKKGQKDK